MADGCGEFGLHCSAWSALQVSDTPEHRVARRIDLSIARSSGYAVSIASMLHALGGGWTDATNGRTLYFIGGLVQHQATASWTSRHGDR
jgi:hypothetical protein